jgi:4-carboxymuconolactone decarboxylase
VTEHPLRLAPLPAEEWDDEVRQAMGPLLPASRANPRDAGNIIGTLVRHPALTHAFLTFNTQMLLRSTLSARVREVAVLRAALNSRSDYLWDHHVPLAQRAGLTLAEIEDVRAGHAAAPVDALVVRVADELDERKTLTDETWAELGEHFDEQQRMDLVFTVGCYQLLALAVNTFGIEPEDH